MLETKPSRSTKTSRNTSRAWISRPRRRTKALATIAFNAAIKRMFRAVHLPSASPSRQGGTDDGKRPVSSEFHQLVREETVRRLHAARFFLRGLRWHLGRSRLDQSRSGRDGNPREPDHQP